RRARARDRPGARGDTAGQAGRRGVRPGGGAGARPGDRATGGRRVSERPRVVEVDLPGARVAFSSRIGGVSDAPYDTLNLGILTGDRHEHVLENRTRLTEQLGLAIDHVAMGWQVHGADLLEWGAPPDGGGFAEPGA